MNHGLGGLVPVFVMLAQATIVRQPGEGSLDHPAFGQQLESFDVIIAFDNLEDPLAKAKYPLNQFARVATISPHSQHARPCPLDLRLLEDELGSVAILNVGRVNDYCEYQAQRIHQDVSLDPVDFFSPRRNLACRRFALP